MTAIFVCSSRTTSLLDPWDSLLSATTSGQLTFMDRETRTLRQYENDKVSERVHRYDHDPSLIWNHQEDTCVYSMAAISLTERSIVECLQSGSVIGKGKNGVTQHAMALDILCLLMFFMCTYMYCWDYTTVMNKHAIIIIFVSSCYDAFVPFRSQNKKNWMQIWLIDKHQPLDW